MVGGPYPIYTTEANMSLRLYIEGMDLLTILYTVYSMVIAPIGKLSITAESHISEIDLSRK